MDFQLQVFLQCLEEFEVFQKGRPGCRNNDRALQTAVPESREDVVPSG